MADPFTMTAISMAASGASAGIGAIGSLASGNSKASAMRYQAGIAEMRARVAKQNADYARITGEYEASASGAKTRLIGGKIRAAQGASGVDVNSGSTVDVQESQLQAGRIDQQMIRNNAARRAYGFEVEGASASADANMARAAASNAETEGQIGAIGSILGGVSSVSSKWLQGNSIGALSRKGVGSDYFSDPTKYGTLY